MSETPFRLSDRLGLTVEEAAHSVGVSARHFRSLLPAIPHVYLGGRIVIPVKAFEDWLREQSLAENSRANNLASEILESFSKD
jgi:hypothetical protein